MRKYNFISGLPRSGSTLLSSILDQNPKFQTGITDSMLGFSDSIFFNDSQALGGRTTVTEETRLEMVRSLFEVQYKDAPEVVFNTNRAWTGATGRLKKLFPEFKMIVCLRHIPWILDSVEKLNNKNPLTLKAIFGQQNWPGSNERAAFLMGEMGAQSGFVTGPLSLVQHSLNCPENREHIMYLEYEALAQDPEGCMRLVYDFLGEEYYAHDYNNVAKTYDEYDAELGLDGLHDVKQKVEYVERPTVMSPMVWNKYANRSFWRSPDFPKQRLNWVGIDNRTPEQIQQSERVTAEASTYAKTLETNNPPAQPAPQQAQQPQPQTSLTDLSQLENQSLANLYK